MRVNTWTRPSRAALAAALLVFAAVPAMAQSRAVLPAGSVITVRTNQPLQSATARTGDAFETVVDPAVNIDDYTVIPAGSRIRGVVSMARAATRAESGVIEVVFDRLTLTNGSSIAIRGRLTSTDSAERRQIEADPNARVVLIGGRGGIGAGIAGAGSRSGSANILTALGAMLSEGRDVNVPAGTSLAVQLERAVTLQARGRVIGDESTLYTSADRIRAAQEALVRLRYYRGSAHGNLDDATRRALFEFQVDRGLPGTGNLDTRTAQALGISVGGVALSNDEASMLRRDASAMVSRYRSELSASTVGRLDVSRDYSPAEIEIWFALSAFSDNASLYEQVVRNGSNRNAAVNAGRALVAAAARVDAALQGAQASGELRNAWGAVRRQIAPLEGMR
jgi:hypothetical protein